MLTINNRPAPRGLAYLSGHRLGLWVLLPTAHAAEWLPETQTDNHTAVARPLCRAPSQQMSRPSMAVCGRKKLSPACAVCGRRHLRDYRL